MICFLSPVSLVCLGLEVSCIIDRGLFTSLGSHPTGDLTLGMAMGWLDKYGLWDLEGLRRNGLRVRGCGDRDIEEGISCRGGEPMGVGMLIGVAGALCEKQVGLLFGLDMLGREWQ